MQGQCSLLERKESSSGERDLVCRCRGVSVVAAMTQGRRRGVSVFVWLAPYLTQLLFFFFLNNKKSIFIWLCCVLVVLQHTGA